MAFYLMWLIVFLEIVLIFRIYALVFHFLYTDEKKQSNSHQLEFDKNCHKIKLKTLNSVQIPDLILRINFLLFLRPALHSEAFILKFSPEKRIIYLSLAIVSSLATLLAFAAAAATMNKSPIIPKHILNEPR